MTTRYTLTVDCMSNNYRGQPRVYFTATAAEDAYKEAVDLQRWNSRRGNPQRYWKVELRAHWEEADGSYQNRLVEFDEAEFNEADD